MTEASGLEAAADAPVALPDPGGAALAMGTSGAPGFAGSVCERLAATAEPTHATAAPASRVTNASRGRVSKEPSFDRMDNAGC
jgi:hypothetical protein